MSRKVFSILVVVVKMCVQNGPNMFGGRGPAGGANALPSNPLAAMKGLTSKKHGGEGKKYRKREGRGKKREGRK